MLKKNIVLKYHYSPGIIWYNDFMEILKLKNYIAKLHGGSNLAERYCFPCR